MPADKKEKRKKKKKGIEDDIEDEEPQDVELITSFSLNENRDAKTPSSDSSIAFPTGIAIHPSGDILVVDNEAKVVKVFNEEGLHRFSFGAGLLKSPWDIIVTESGKIAVSDVKAGDVKVFSKSGRFLMTSELGYHLQEPYGIAYHKVTKEMAVGDIGTNCVYIYTPAGIVKDILTTDPEIPPLSFPAYVHMSDHNNHILVSDMDLHQLNIYDENSQLLFTYGSEGIDHKQLQNPCSVCTNHDGNILLADSSNCRVHLLDKTGNFLCYAVTWEDGLAEPQAMAVMPNGHLVITEATTELVKIYRCNYENIIAKYAEKAESSIGIENAESQSLTVTEYST